MQDDGMRLTVDRRPRPVAPRRTAPIDRAEALRLLGTVSLGRIVFTRNALPAVRPVNHFMEEEHIVVRVHDGASVASIVSPHDTDGVVVAYEADVIDPETHLGWSVVVTGYAYRVTDAAELAHYESSLLPWVAHPAMTGALRIRPDIVSGTRLTT
ncbi:pyridoxamine 5'-phosphate oxidase family protein [Streptomyces nitrosporeus]|uniref:Pyridoxamine 5'-phosphate oxidase family protein n=1 Tax=Streptomyces nitrosporeus TaxID=28894 RepID=A0A5J6FGM2_9ACTN|nr:pyridoxamine 5'-phosphate oxidase family protein [Streptomyces nitrosporeus]QEU75699.1 pyridoxamine 5'-phosphate oxidase family protein [Streptomyces nitrosporeus]GGY87339.1 hypothetical protein GCM10010327_17410 [Streptomyces nitrosporeus]